VPYLPYARLRTEEPVGVVTRYADVVTVLQSFSAQCAPAPQRLNSMGLSTMDRIGQIMVLQHPFMGPPDHTRLRAVCSQALAPHRVERLPTHILEIVDSLQEPHLFTWPNRADGGPGESSCHTLSCLQHAGRSRCVCPDHGISSSALLPRSNGVTLCK